MPRRGTGLQDDHVLAVDELPQPLVLGDLARPASGEDVPHDLDRLAVVVDLLDEREQVGRCPRRATPGRTLSGYNGSF